MKFDLDRTINDFKNRPVVVPTGDGQDGTQDLTLSNAIATICTAPKMQEEKMDQPKFLKLFEIGLKCVNGGEVDLSNEEVNLILKRADTIFPHPLIIGRLHELLDPKSPE